MAGFDLTYLTQGHEQHVDASGKVTLVGGAWTPGDSTEKASAEIGTSCDIFSARKATDMQLDLTTSGRMFWFVLE